MWNLVIPKIFKLALFLNSKSHTPLLKLFVGQNDIHLNTESKKKKKKHLVCMILIAGTFLYLSWADNNAVS